MVVSDYGKLIVLTVVICGLFGGMIFGDVTMEQVDQYFLLIIGYLIGNGVNAINKKAPTSVVMSKVGDDEVLTIHGSYPAERETNDSGTRPGDS
jgi:Na+(H+)/acetate symporter ActP